jgi:hypothetical protein
MTKGSSTRQLAPYTAEPDRQVMTIVARFQQVSHECHRRRGRHAVAYNHP